MLKPKVLLVASVLAVHMLAVWALQQGLLRPPPAPEPLRLVSVTVLPPSPAPAKPQSAVRPTAMEPTQAAQARAKADVGARPKPFDPAAQPAPQQPAQPPSPTAQSTQAAPKTVGAGALGSPLAQVDTTATAPSAAPSAEPRQQAAPPPAPAAPQTELPSSNAAYLNNPKPLYPYASRKNGETGLVLLTVVVDTLGRAKSVQIKTSSGHDRLDQAARKGVERWTFVPGKRGGVPVETTVEVPIPFGLDPPQ